MASSSSEPAAQAVQPSPSQHLMYKNHLQEFAQRSNIALPVYQTLNEGQHHAPQFRSTVWVDGTCYTSQLTFPQRKAAEQEAARLALECLTKKTRDEGFSLVWENATFCKSILNEYAAKMNLQRPTYNTVRQEGLLPVFISSLVFNGISYTGDAARSKKDAEQLGARAAILSILGDSDSGTMLFQMIKSKSKFYDAVKGKGVQTNYASGVSPVANTAPTSVTMDQKDKEVADPVVADPMGDNDNNVGDNENNETKVEFPESCKMLSLCEQSQMPSQGSTPEVTEPPNVPVQPGTTHPIDDGSSSKKRRKNRKKANKKSRLETPLPTGFPMNQAPSCSVTQ